MGGKSGGGSTTTVQKADPWSGVQPFMSQGYEQLASLYGTPTYGRKGNLTDWTLGAGPQYFPGQTVASPNFWENFGQNMALGANPYASWLSNMGGGGLENLFQAPGQTGWGLGAAQDARNQLAGAGQNFLGTGNTAANRGMGGVGGWSEIAGGQGLSSLQGGTDALRRFMDSGQSDFGYNTGMNRLLGFSEGNTPWRGEAGALSAMDQLMAAGNPANNPFFQGAVQSAIRPVTQQFNEQVMPGIQSNSLAAGGLGGTRQGVAQGIAGRGYLDTIGDIASSMGNQAYAQGLGALQSAAGIGQNILGMGQNAALQAAQLGQAGRGMGQNAASTLANLGQTGVGQALSGFSSLGGLGAQLAGMGGNMTGSAGQLGSDIWGRGLQSAGQGAALAPGLMQAAYMPGQMTERIGQQRTADEQAQIDAEMARWNYGQNLPYSMMSDYLSMLQGAPGGVTSSSMQGGGGSMLGRLAGGGLMGGSLGSLMGAGAAGGPAMWPFLLGGGALGLFA